MKSVALLDVDGTLIIGQKKKYNDDLINALIEQGILDVYLFTDMTFSKHSIEQREALIEYLTIKGLIVHGALTPNDLTWNFRDDARNGFCDALLKSTIDLRKPSRELSNLLSEHLEKLDPAPTLPGFTYELAKKEIDMNGEAISKKSKECKLIHDAITCMKYISMEHDKVLLFAHFAKHLPDWADSIIVVDDKKECRDGALKANQEFGLILSVIDPVENEISKLLLDHKHKVEIIHGEMPIQPIAKKHIEKVFLFDRDDTLMRTTNQKDLLINADFIVPMIRTLDELDIPFGIVAHHGYSPEQDPALDLISNNIELQNKPLYPIYGRHQNERVYDMDSESKDSEWMIEGGSELLNLQFGATFLLGRSLVRVNPMLFYGKIVYRNMQDNKLFGILMALDEAELRTPITTELEDKGIINIETPAYYQSINPSQVIFLNSDIENCSFLKACGFTAVHADIETKKNTYINKMLDYIYPLQNGAGKKMYEGYQHKYGLDVSCIYLNGIERSSKHETSDILAILRDNNIFNLKNQSTVNDIITSQINKMAFSLKDEIKYLDKKNLLTQLRLDCTCIAYVCNFDHLPILSEAFDYLQENFMLSKESFEIVMRLADEFSDSPHREREEIMEACKKYCSDKKSLLNGFSMFQKNLDEKITHPGYGVSEHNTQITII